MKLCQTVNRHKSRPSSKLGHVGSKTRSLGQIIKKNRVYILEGTILNQSSLNFVRMLTLIESRSVLNVGHVGSKTRSLGQILETSCEHSRGQNFDLKSMKLCQNDNPYKI